MSQREKPSNQLNLSPEDQDRIVRMAWEDRTSFDAIERQFGLSNGQVIALMRRLLNRSAFVRWRKRTAGRHTKHDQLRGYEFGRFRAPGQRGD
ncbi:MAG: TIGR03643 family protein [Planctomycetaceae bacterium]